MQREPIPKTSRTKLTLALQDPISNKLSLEKEEQQKRIRKMSFNSKEFQALYLKLDKLDHLIQVLQEDQKRKEESNQKISPETDFEEKPKREPTKYHSTTTTTPPPPPPPTGFSARRIREIRRIRNRYIEKAQNNKQQKALPN